MSVSRRSSPPPPKGPGDLDALWQGLGWVPAPPQSRKAQASFSGAWARGPGLLGLAQHAPDHVACSLRSDEQMTFVLHPPSQPLAGGHYHPVPAAVMPIWGLSGPGEAQSCGWRANVLISR